MISNLDDLKYEGGYPTVESIQKLYDQLDVQRTAQAYLDFIPAMSMQAVLNAHPRDYGVSETGGMIVYVEPGEAKPMTFPDASGVPVNMLPISDATAFDELKKLVDTEGPHLADPDRMGMLAGLGIVKGEP